LSMFRTPFFDMQSLWTKGLVVVLIPWMQACSPSDPNEARNALASARACLDHYHEAAAKAQFQEYFQCMGDSSVFVGTDASEHWTKEEFMAYAQPHFDKGKAWSMQPLTRQFHFTADSSVAWFEELRPYVVRIHGLHIGFTNVPSLDCPPVCCQSYVSTCGRR
ncbi:MAG: nuclear transport factor 2 family protein, partial [Bacteroidota bacterium]